ncbi:UNVERIFIED_CONTAM: hypothetical protein RMT77_007798 [Armadillidium vulgare]|nr:hypothetical protein Avbf_14419 [Armadillidium vulgare]RXG57420.1 hypothetical protein Avbf_10913 [Armadillidium vulgare]
MGDHSPVKSAKENDWMSEYYEWLAEDTSTNSLWCNVCQKSIKKRKHNVELHASTNKHLKNMKGMNDVLKNMKEDPLDYVDHEDPDYLHSEPEQLDYTTFGSMKREEQNSFEESKEDMCTIENEDENAEYEYINEQSNEIDEFARSIAAQMKMLPEDQVISLFYEIQNLITQKRLQAFENRHKNQESNIIISAFDINEDI